MIIKKNLNVKDIIGFSWLHIIWLLFWSLLTAIFYHFFDYEWMNFPWLPLSILGTAVAFYIGFKNNSAYDRLWEARKIWGAIVNSSRMWGATLSGFLDIDQPEVNQLKQKLIYRHIAWLYVLRDQLLIPTSWEHVRDNLRGNIKKYFERRKRKFGIGLYGDEITKIELDVLLDPAEKQRLIAHKNTATQIIKAQSEEINFLYKKGLIDSFKQVELQGILNDFYNHQGKCERIKKFPLPRQYASMSFIFVSIFIFLLPFGMHPAFQQLSPHWGHWLAIPFIALIGWVFVMMELIGDYSENPFEGLGNDIPMLSLCRTIEIDLREMLGEEELPPAIQPVGSVLM